MRCGHCEHSGWVTDGKERKGKERKGKESKRSGRASLRRFWNREQQFATQYNMVHLAVDGVTHVAEDRRGQAFATHSL
jgi:hypothetical protein